MGAEVGALSCNDSTNNITSDRSYFEFFSLNLDRLVLQYSLAL